MLRTRSFAHFFFFSNFSFSITLPLSAQLAVLQAIFAAENERAKSEGTVANESQSAGMKINECPTQPSLKSGWKCRNVIQTNETPGNTLLAFARAGVCR